LNKRETFLQDADVIHLARGAPRRWFAQTAEAFGIMEGPTRFGKVSYSMRPQAAGGVTGSVSVTPRAGVAQVAASSLVSKNGLFEPFLYKNENFTKTGSGQT
jgi:hypothetical protein